MLPSVTDAVGGKAPILIDDSFRRGADVLKALALGARAVLDRPSCSLASSDTAEGVQTVLGMLQSELARSMGLCGKPNIQVIDGDLVRIPPAVSDEAREQ